MNRFISILGIILLTALILPGCTRVGSSMNGSGKIIDDELKLEGFSSLNVKGPFVVEVTQARDFQVILSTDDNLLNRVRFSLERQTLNLSIQAPATFFPTSLKLKVGMPDLNNINLSESARAVVNGFTNIDALTVFLAGKSTLNSAMEVNTIELNLSGASEIFLQGKAQSINVDARGASKLNLAEFECSSAEVKLTEASEATMDVLGSVDITLQKASKFFYVGSPVFRDTNISGGSTMAHK